MYHAYMVYWQLANRKAFLNTSIFTHCKKLEIICAAVTSYLAVYFNITDDNMIIQYRLLQEKVLARVRAKVVQKVTSVKQVLLRCQPLGCLN